MESETAEKPMKTWYIETDGVKHNFTNWKDVCRTWDIVKATQSGAAYLYRGDGTLIDFS